MITSVPSDAVAVVDGTPVTKAELDGLLARAKATYKTQKRAFPKAGTSEYQSLQTQAVAFLVQRAEYDNRAEELKLTVTDKEIDARIDQVKKQSFGGSQAKLDKQLKEQGYTTASLRADIRAQLLSEKIYDSVTKDAKVTDADDREVLHSRTRASTRRPRAATCATSSSRRRRRPNRIYDQLKAGGELRGPREEVLARPGLEGQRRQAHDHPRARPSPRSTRRRSCSRPNQISRPVKTQYGYHVIQPISAVKPAKVTPLKDAKPAIKAHAPRQGEERRDHQVDGRHQERTSPRRSTYATGFAPPEAATDDQLGDDHRLSVRVPQAGDGRSPRRSSTCRS